MGRGGRFGAVRGQPGEGYSSRQVKDVTGAADTQGWKHPWGWVSMEMGWNRTVPYLEVQWERYGAPTPTPHGGEGNGWGQEGPSRSA